MIVVGGIKNTLILFYFLITKLYQLITSLRELALDLSNCEADLTKRLELGRLEDLGQIADGIDLFINKVHLAVKEIVGISGNLSNNVATLQSLKVKMQRALVNTQSKLSRLHRLLMRLTALRNLLLRAL